MIMDKKWIRNGVFASDTIKLNGCVVSNPTAEQLMAAGFEEYKEPVPTDEEKLEQARRQKIAEIEAYDTSSSVNDFTLNGKHRWLPMEKRQGIAYSANVLKENGNATISIWFDDEQVNMPISNAIDMLNELEVYAKKTNDVTHQHKANVAELKTIDDVEKFDITADYPSKLDYQF